MIAALRPVRPLPIGIGVALLLLAGTAAVVTAQLERGDRGIAPIDSSANFEVGGVDVDVSGPNADAARQGGWRLAQRRAWKLLWARANARPPEQAPGLPDSTLDQIVAGIEVEREQIAPRRYVARLGVLFDRARAGQLLGRSGGQRRSAPMLVIPVMMSGGTALSFEAKNPWQYAWAQFRTGGSPIDYIRPIGTGVDPLLLNAAQTGRPGRGWWRLLLDQYGAADVVIPVVTLERRWPGGPVSAQFAALHGPDRDEIARFTLTADSSDGMARMLAEGVRRIDAAYTRALIGGRLNADPTLVIEEEVADDLLDSIAEPALADDAIAGGRSIVAVQVDTADDAALSAVQASIRAIPGVSSVSTSSIAFGGVSVLRVTFAGDPTALRSQLAAAGVPVRAFRVEQAPAPPAPPPVAPPPPVEPAR